MLRPSIFALIGGTAAALGAAVGLVLATSAQAPAPHPQPTNFETRVFAPGRGMVPAHRAPTARTQSANVVLDVQDDAFLVLVESFGKKFTVDPAKLRFAIRAVNGGIPQSFAAEIGEPVLDRTVDQGQEGAVRWYHLPITFAARPARPGMYDVALVTTAGFVRADDGSAIAVEGAPHADIYWPDETGDDAGLRTAREAIDGRTVYGLGGLVLSCGSASFKTYQADVGIAVTGVQRRRHVERLWTGSMTSWGNDAAYSFFAVDPLAVTATYPAAQTFASGGSSQPAGDAPCPGFYLADPWHLEVTLTTVKPPPLQQGFDQFKIARGMTRDEVARRRGYPQGYFTRAALDHQSVWAYFDGPADEYTITFREGRVAAFTVPPGLP